MSIVTSGSDTSWNINLSVCYVEILELPKLNKYLQKCQGGRYASRKNFSLLRENLKSSVISLLNLLVLYIFPSVCVEVYVCACV